MKLVAVFIAESPEAEAGVIEQSALFDGFEYEDADEGGMLRPFFTFFGGKWRVAPHYPAPEFPKVIEPFAGSAGYSIRYAHLDVHLNDADPTIAGLWDYLIHVSSDEIMRLPAAVEHVSEVPGPDEARWLVGFWLNKAMTAPCNVPSKWLRDGWRPNSSWGEVVRALIATQVEMIRHWTVSCGPFDALADEPATWFVDPPYLVSGRRYKYHDVDFPALAEWCRGRSGQVMVCEQEGADWLPFEPFRSVKALEGKRGAKVSHEVLWTTST